MKLERYQEYYISLPFIILSFFGSLFIISVSLLNKKLRKSHPFIFVFALSTFDIVSTSSKLIPPSYLENNTICNIQATVSNTFCLSSLLWTDFLSLEFFNIMQRKKYPLYYGFKCPYLLIFLFSLVVSIIPIYFEAYTITGVWCYIKSSNDIKNMMLILFSQYFYAWGTCLWNLVIACIIFRKSYMRASNKEVNAVKYYPLASAICIIPLSITRIYKDIDPLVKLVFTCFYLCLGFINSLLYGYNTEVRSYITRSFHLRSSKTYYSPSLDSLKTIRKLPLI